VDGLISADGETVAGNTSGSGGSVWLTCHSLSGSGTIRADGGYGTRGDLGGGGGGRVAVILTNGTTFGSVTMQALPAWMGARKAGGGTVYTKTGTQTYGTLKVDNSNLSVLSTEGAGKGTPIPAGETWEVEQLVLLNHANLRVTNNTTLNFRGAKSFTGSESNGCLIVEDGGTLGIAGDLTVANATLMTHWNATVNGLTNLTIGSGGFLSHLPNVNASDAYKLKLDIPGNLAIQSGGSVSVKGRGHDKGYGPGVPSSTYNGGSYGGQGGRYSGQTGDGDTYGSVLAPTNCGSGPGTSGITDGGGAARLIVGGATTVNGQILADGSDGVAGYCGGSGGSIYLTTATLSGTGVVRAAGGDDPDRTDVGQGGGGRVSVVLTSGTSFGTIDFSARGGTCGGTGSSAPGTVYLESSAAGTGGGRVIIDRKGEDHATLTYLPPEAQAITDELIGATVVVTGANSKLNLTANITVGDVLLFTDGDGSGGLILGVYTMYVNSAEHHIDDGSQSGPGGPTNTYVDNYDQIIWQGVQTQPGPVFILR